MREFLDTILAFIQSESLTDDEFESLDVAVEDYTEEVYLALRGVLEARENVSGQVKRLKLYFIAKGIELTSSTKGPKPMSNIYLGDAL